jgi:integrase/recombinase XerD
MNLSACVRTYFEDYLNRIKGASPETIKNYRDAFSLFLRFSSEYYSTPVGELTLEGVTPALIFSFLDWLEKERGNTARTRNNRLAALKSFARMIRLLHAEHVRIADMILNIPQKKTGKKLVGYLQHEDMVKVFDSVDLKKKEGFRDYAILNLLYDSGARASEIARLNIDWFDPDKKKLAILGKGERYRMIGLWPKTTGLLECYIADHRPEPKPAWRKRLFVNQRLEEFTRHGIRRLCKKYLEKSLPAKQLKNLNPAHSFRHSCAVNLLLSGASLTDIKNHLGHENLNSTMIYLHLNITRKKEIQKKFIEYTESRLKQDEKIDELIDWENKTETLKWLDSL